MDVQNKTVTSLFEISYLQKSRLALAMSCTVFFSKCDSMGKFETIRDTGKVCLKPVGIFVISIFAFKKMCQVCCCLEKKFIGIKKIHR